MTYSSTIITVRNNGGVFCLLFKFTVLDLVCFYVRIAKPSLNQVKFVKVR